MKELGIRVALGARARHVLHAALGRPTVLLGVGSLVGLLLGTFASRLLEQIVYQANPRDPVVIAGAAVTMVLLGVAASAIPAMRALAATCASRSSGAELGLVRSMRALILLLVTSRTAFGSAHYTDAMFRRAMALRRLSSRADPV
jgi:predicted lysophospholipase L1 biosynthesis ABC-type transport system permease subunit